MEGQSVPNGGRGARIQLHNVSHAFVRSGATLEVLRGVEINVDAGETLAIVGPSGSGKSTLLSLIMGRLKPTSGRVEIWDKNGKRPKLGVVFQDPALLPWLNAMENVLLPLELEGRLGAAGFKVRDALAKTHLTDFAEFRPRQLSGGMQSRVALARALVNQPDLVLLDEPFGSLDEATSEAMMIELAQLIEDTGATAILITHSLIQATYLADRVAVLSSRPGRVAEIVKIDRARPRSPEFIEHPSFNASVQTLRRSLREAVLVPTS